jgi:hypothetical protein
MPRRLWFDDQTDRVWAEPFDYELQVHRSGEKHAIELHGLGYGFVIPLGFAQLLGHEPTLQRDGVLRLNTQIVIDGYRLVDGVMYVHLEPLDRNGHSDLDHLLERARLRMHRLAASHVRCPSAGGAK